MTARVSAGGSRRATRSPSKPRDVMPIPPRCLNLFARSPPPSPRVPEPPVHRRVPVRLRRRQLLIGDLLLQAELLELPVTLLVAYVQALARLGIGIDVLRLAVAHVLHDLPRCQRLQMRELLGRIGRLHLKARGRQDLLGLGGLMRADSGP